MKMSIDEFKKKYPHLAKEILDESSDRSSSSITVRFKGTYVDPWHNYIPGPLDYLRRAKSVEEALRVIEYLEKRGEISSDEASEYREKLFKEGLDAFGPRKEENYYYRKAVEYWRKLINSSQS
ncbi:MAG: DUF2095 family protein [Sulfolobales archaeon]|nr:DUF2095 family protein [Sulfolobales archaeon]MCX8199454.1 DUF2095 family protein [Sulfolobales archaeon]MDW8170231.1 DUF2095 family protein [Desulfurococcaceae archaeon]